MHNENLRISSIGFGTYMGEPDDITDFLMYNAIKQSVLSGGLNHIDTAANYRYMKSERTVGKILTVLQNKYGINRNMLFVSSKAGYIPENA
jgi:aryl-alcohol dehydrogenase-like predicted oxidoreductase